MTEKDLTSEQAEIVRKMQSALADEDKVTNENPVSLKPLSFVEAMKGLLNTPPPPKDDTSNKKA